MKPVLEEIYGFSEDARRQSAFLFQTLLVYNEEHVTERLSKIILQLCKALQRGRNEAYGDAQVSTPSSLAPHEEASAHKGSVGVDSTHMRAMH